MRRLSLLLLVACGTAQAPVPGAFDMSGETALTIAGSPVSRAYLDAMREQLPPEELAQINASGGQKMFSEQMALGQVLWEKAVAQGVHQDPALKLKLDLAARDVIVRALLDKVADDAVTDAALQAAYDARAAEFKQPQARARLLPLADAAKAEEVLTLLKNGADFDAVAGAHAVDPARAAQDTTESDWFTKGQLNPEIDGAMFAPGAGDLLGPFPGPTGVFVIKVTSRRDAIPLDDVRDELTAGIEQDAIRTFLNETQAASPVEWKGPVPGEAPALPGLTPPAPQPM